LDTSDEKSLFSKLFSASLRFRGENGFCLRFILDTSDEKSLFSKLFSASLRFRGENGFCLRFILDRCGL
jgi:ubiquitin